jgi:protein dithiol oxidoreductase (disulfide-forming)
MKTLWGGTRSESLRLSAPLTRRHVVMPSRRQFSVLAASSVAAVCLPAAAQGQPVEGRHYLAVSPRQPTRDPKQVEVLEFFAYSCHHCHDFEPALDAWQKQLPADVLFRRIPVAFREDLVVHNELFFAIEALGLVERLHRKVFEAVHASRGQLKAPQEIAAFASANGVDPKVLINTMASFSVAGKVKQAFALSNGYGIEGTPALGIDGRWLTSGSMAGSNPRSLAVAEFLVRAARQKR